DFLYPEPTHVAPGERIDIVPVTPDQWETTPTGWFQAFYLLGTDEEGRAAFDGRQHYVLTAHRGPLPEAGAKPS
ncbi:MAG TPA: hypothetical protein VNZ52_11115, partial [Candidatus Thermoplasmatota archaeon]|nr:hypothetical protein [Candidatus Thermoplasmatota archaeon]